MKPMSLAFALFQLMGLSSLWALICFGVYGALRLLSKKSRLALSVLGWLAFVAQVVALGGFVILFLAFAGMPVSGPNPPPSSSPDSLFDFQFIMGVLVIWFVPLLFGAKVMQRAAHNRGSWGAHFASCALYLVAAPASTWCVAFIWWRLTGSYPAPRADPVVWLFDSWEFVCKSAGLDTRGSIWWDFLSLFLLWIFPLGAPLAEIIFHLFKRAHGTNKTGSLV